ncbi:MAG: helix-turn-helix transcriptional regulator [Chitinophagaceae bacterium]
MLTLNIMPVIRARYIERPYSFLVKAGFSRHTAHLLLKSSTHVFRLDHIEKLCRIFICEPHDLLSFTPDKDAPLPPGHPLFKLHKNEPPPDWKETLAAIPYNELKEITGQLKKS